MSVKPHGCVCVLCLKIRVCAQEIKLGCLDQFLLLNFAWAT